MKTSYYILFSCWLVSLCFACQKVELDTIQNLNDNRIAIVGHGGSGFPVTGLEPPANSMESIEKAVRGFGVDGVEVDVQISADSVLMVYHDAQLGSLTNCQGCVVEHNAETLVNCRYRSTIGAGVVQPHRLIRLEEVLRLFAQRQRPPTLLLDIKLFTDCPAAPNDLEHLFRVSKELNHLITRFNAQKWVLIETPAVALLKQMHELNPELRLIWSSRPAAQIIELAREYDIFGFGFRNSVVNRQEIQMLHAEGFRVVLYEVRTRNAAMEAVNKSPDYIETDNIVVLQEMLGR